MDYNAFTRLLSDTGTPVVLLEGTRELPPQQAPYLTALAAHLARTFPHLHFRTGNAKGSDEAFAKGVAGVDPSRLEYVLPYATHRTGQRAPGSVALAVDGISMAREQEVMDATVQASPQYERMAVNYRKEKVHPRQLASTRLILRDTLKVMGDGSLVRPVAGIFFVHAADPDRGGTGHTMRVCRSLGVPVISQFQWLDWPF
jgi:hypothetical protein